MYYNGKQWQVQIKKILPKQSDTTIYFIDIKIHDFIKKITQNGRLIAIVSEQTLNYIAFVVNSRNGQD